MARWRGSDGSVHELPKMTLAMSELTDAAQAATGRERYEAEWELLSAALPAEALAAEVDGDGLETCDVVALECCYQGVVAAYAKPMLDARAAAVRAQLESVRPAIDAVSKVAPAVGATRRVR